MRAKPTLQNFIDDELMRAPLIAEQAIEGTLEALSRIASSMSPGERAIAGDLSAALRKHRTRLSAAYSESLRAEVSAELQRRGPAAEATPSALARFDTELRLVDEEAVASDVEVARTVEAIKSTAEFELRELATFTAALAGDMDVAVDHNPVRADAHARALWVAAQVLPLSGASKIMFMRHASLPLAQVLRKAYASACRRLEDGGVEPGAYRTVILAAGARGGRTLSDQALRDIADQLAHTSTAVSDHQRLEILGRLFDFVLADRLLTRPVKAAISRLQTSALRMALRDPKLLDRPDHPLWLLVDAIAAQAELLPDPPHPERMRAIEHIESLIEHIGQQAEPDAELFRAALDRLAAFDRQRVARLLQAHAGQIERLMRLDHRLARNDGGPQTSAGALDVAQLDTVPAELLDSLPEPATAAVWLDERRPGDTLRLFLQGQWLHTLMLWRGEMGEVWLFADGRSDRVWAIQRAALNRLHAEGLAQPLLARSLVHEAIEVIAPRIAGKRR